MEVKIEKGIPMPTVSRGGFPWTATFNKMEVGDSFVVPAKQAGLARRMIATIKGKKFITRTIESELRIWRQS